MDLSLKKLHKALLVADAGSEVLRRAGSFAGRIRLFGVPQNRRRKNRSDERTSKLPWTGRKYTKISSPPAKRLYFAGLWHKQSSLRWKRNSPKRRPSMRKPNRARRWRARQNASTPLPGRKK